MAFEWAVPASTGGVPLTGYRVVWNQGGGSSADYVTLVSVADSVTSYTLT